MHKSAHLFAALSGAGLLLAACGSAAAPAPASSAPPTGVAAPASAAAKPSASTAAPASVAGSAAAKPSGSAAAKPAAALKASVGVSSVSASQLSTYLAKEKGFYAQNGLDADVITIQGGTATDALIANQIQLLQISTKVLQADVSGADLVFIGAPLPGDRFWMVGKKGMTDPKELKGKRLGVTGVGTATYVWGRIVLSKSGLDPDHDVQLANLNDNGAIMAAVQAGSVDAGMMSMPQIFQARALGLPVLVDTSKLDFPFPSAWNAVSKKYAAEHGDIVRAYMKSMAQAVAFQIKQPEETQQLLAKFTKTDDPNIVKQTYEAYAPTLNKTLDIDMKAVQNALDDLATQVPAAKGQDPAKFVDDTYVKEMKASGFIDSLYK
jgi:NitT/TauT family transport system substrate-binding protein